MAPTSSREAAREAPARSVPHAAVLASKPQRLARRLHYVVGCAGDLFSVWSTLNVCLIPTCFVCLFALFTPRLSFSWLQYCDC